MKEKELEERLNDFIIVMKNVCNAHNKRKINLNGPDEINCSRYRLLSTAEGTGQTSVHKKRKMETSTPVAYRHQPALLPDSSPGSDSQDIYSESDESQLSLATKNISNELERKHHLSRRMCKIELTPPKEETHVFTEARNFIAANETLDSSDTYRRRINTYPSRGARQIVKKNILKHARSHIHVNIAQGMHAEFISAQGMDVEFINSQGMNAEFINGQKRDLELIINVEKVGRCEDIWANNETFGLETLFLEKEDVEARQIDEIILEKTKNKLYEIFVRTCPNKPVSRPGRAINRRIGGDGGTGVPVTPGKRRLSPQPESHMGNPTKTACSTPGAGHTRSRANSTCGTVKSNKPRSRQRLYTISGQKLLTQMWRNNDI